MDPNYANLWNQMYSLSQHPSSSSAGMSLLEQAAIQTGLTPSFSMGHGMAGGQMLTDPSLMRSAPVTMSSQPASNYTATPVPSVTTPRLPPFSNIKEKSQAEADNLLRDTTSMPALTVGHSDVAKWSALFPDYGVRASDPPPAHSGPSRSSSQVKSRVENDQPVDALFRRQTEASNPPKAHQPLAPQKYHESYNSTSKYQEPVPKFSTPPIQKYQDPSSKYQDTAHHNKYQELLSETIPGYLIQKAPVQNYREADVGKLIRQDYPGHDMGSKYPEENLPMSRGATQLHRMMSSSEPSPQSHDSSPHMGLSSPQISHHNSPQMANNSGSNSLVHDPHAKYSSYGGSSVGNIGRPYSASSTPAIYNQQNVSSAAATLHYEAVSPAAQQHSEHMNYNTLNLEGLTSENQVKVTHDHSSSMLSMKIPSPPIHSNSPMSVASPTSTVQHVPSGPIRAQADSTTKSKRGARRGGGNRGGGRGGRNKKMKKEEDDMHQMTSALQMQHQQQQQQLSRQIPNMQLTSQPDVTMQQHSIGMLQSAAAHAGGTMMADMNMPAYSSMADTYGVNQYSDETMLQVNVAQGMLGMMASPDLKSEQESILMNMNENRGQYMNEGEENVMNQLKEESTELMSHIGGGGADTVEDNVGLGLTSVEARRPKQKTKAELKGQPQDVEMDEEFGHLAATNRGKNGETESRPKLASKDSSFQSSFLSFLQGNKQETLSSVTNSSITTKPELPKYIPEPPRPKPILEKLSSDMSIKPVTFSDDDDSSRGTSSGNLNQTVQGVISELGKEKSEKRYKSFLSKPDERSPLRLKIKMSDIKIPAASSQKLPRRSKSKDSKSKHNRRDSVEEYYAEVVQVEDDDGSPERSPSPVVRQRSTRKAKEKVEEKRKARLEKRVKKKKKPLRGEFSDYSSTEDFFESEEERDYDSDKDPIWIPGEKTQELFSQELDPEIRRNQLSLVKSKVTRPFVRRRRKESEDDLEDDSISGKKPKPSAAITGSSSGGTASTAGSKGGTGGGASSGTTGGGTGRAGSTGPSILAIKTKAVVMEECDSDDNSPHQYSKGNFVMEKKELCNPEKFVIWKIDAGKLIQKYEPFTLDGKLVHKSLSTYSSWSDYFRPNYIGIQVRTISQMKNQEVVEVLEAYQPKKEDEHLESEDHMSSFNVFVQILVSHSLEPGFLSLVKQHDDDYYTMPLQRMEDLLAEKERQVGETVKWSPQFKEAIEKYPLLRISEKYSVENSVHCQASVKYFSEVAMKTARLYGEPYNPESLDKAPSGLLAVDKALEFHIGQTATKCLRQYHRLHHFKYRIFKKCLYMVDCCKRSPGKDTSELLDQCLQNRVWVQNLFRELKLLLDLPESSGNKNSSTSSNSSSKPNPYRTTSFSSLAPSSVVTQPLTTLSSSAQGCSAVTSSTSPQLATPSPLSPPITTSSSSPPPLQHPLQQQLQQQQLSVPAAYNESGSLCTSSGLSMDSQSTTNLLQNFFPTS